MTDLYVLDYGAGNVRSLYNAIERLGYKPKRIRDPKDFLVAKKLIFPGVGSFGSAMTFLKKKQYFEPLKQYIHSGKAYFGICIGMQALFRSSEESPGIQGLDVLHDTIQKFPTGKGYPAVPHIGWNGLRLTKESTLFKNTSSSSSEDEKRDRKDELYYFVHSFRAKPNDTIKEWTLSLTDYGNDAFVSAVQRGNVVATQFHPEKSGKAGLALIDAFLSSDTIPDGKRISTLDDEIKRTRVSRRVVAGLDVRPNDEGEMVLTKGLSYDVRETGSERKVRNLGDPVESAHHYYLEGCDEIVFLNIKSFATDTLGDSPMMRVLERASERIFVPLTIGGGIRSYTTKDGKTHSALDVAAAYFRAGADKVSIGSAAVKAVETYIANGETTSGDSCIETIVTVYGRQAVVVSIDPRRVYLADDEACDAARKAGHTVVRCDSRRVGPHGETRCWYQLTVKGGRETRPLDAVRFARCCERLGAGELLINCIDQDGRKSGFDLELINAVCDAVTIPVIASSGAGCPAHFTEVFQRTRSEAALGAGIFHRRETRISEVKEHMKRAGVSTRRGDKGGKG